MIKGLFCLDLEDYTELSMVKPEQLIMKGLYVSIAVHEGIIKDVGMLDDELQIGDVPGCQRRDTQLAVGKVDAFVGPQSRTLLFGQGDFHQEFCWLNADNHTANPAVIEEDTITAFDVGEDFRQGAADDSMMLPLSLSTVVRWPPKYRLRNDTESIAFVEQQASFKLG